MDSVSVIFVSSVVATVIPVVRLLSKIIIDFMTRKEKTILMKYKDSNIEIKALDKNQIIDILDKIYKLNTKQSSGGNDE